MARSPYDLDSASSQFFIVQDDSLFLDGHYAAFGHVTAGMEVVDEIVKKVKPIDDNGTIKIYYNTINHLAMYILLFHLLLYL